MDYVSTLQKVSVPADAAERLLLDSSSSRPVGMDYLKQNVVNPLLNNALVEPYNAAAHIINATTGAPLEEINLLKTAQNKFASTDWFLQSAAGGLGMIVPYTLAGKFAGGAMRETGARLGAEGITASILKNQSVAYVAGAAMYDGLRNPKENETRLGNMLGGAAAFTVFGVGNQFTKELPLAGKLIARAATGFIGADTALTVSRLTATGQAPNSEELLQSGVGGAFMNNVLPHAQEFVDSQIQRAQLASGGKVWLDQYIDRRPEIQAKQSTELQSLLATNTWAKAKYGAHNEFDSRGHGTVILDPMKASAEDIGRGLARIEQSKTMQQETAFLKAKELLQTGKSEDAFEAFRSARVAQEGNAFHRGQLISSELSGSEVLAESNLALEIGAWAAPGKQTYEMRIRQEFNQFASSNGNWRPGETITAPKAAPVEQPKFENATAKQLAALEQRQTATDLVKELQEAGHIAVFAGGAVRDEIRGQLPKDFDIATSATPAEVEAALRKHGYSVNLTGKQFGVIKVHIKGKLNPEGEEYDIATLRTDGNYTDGRRPDGVKYVASLYEDAARRDLTFNAMFKDPVSGRTYDFFGGQNDMANKIVRTVGEPGKRFGEDFLRMIRIPRLIAQKFPDFTVDPETHAAMKENAAGIKNVSGERMGQEVRSMLTGQNPVAGLDLMMDTGLMEHVLPEVANLTGPKAMQDPIWHPEGSTWNHTRLVLGGLTGSRFETMLAGLLHDIGKPETQKIWPDGGISNYGHAEAGAKRVPEIAERLKYSNAETSTVQGIVNEHMKMHDVEKMNPSTLKKLLELPYIEDLITLQHADAMGTGRTDGAQHSKTAFLRAKLAEFAAAPEAQKLGAKPIIDGGLLLGLGIKRGPRLGEIKNAAFDAQRNGAFSTPDDALIWLRSNTPELQAH